MNEPLTARTDSMASPAAEAREEIRLDAGTLFRQHGRFVANFLWKMGIEAQELDDLLQEVFMVAHRRGGFVPGPARATTWLAEIAVRVASTRRRGWRRRPEQPDTKALAALVTEAPSPAEAAEAVESLRRVRARARGPGRRAPCGLRAVRARGRGL
jgi:RNA polymerase sigma-70 factor (ECF subfamily)